MNEPFNLPVIYQGETKEYEARFERFTYTHRFIVLIDGETFTFEPDDEGNYRAIGKADTDPTLLQAISRKLSSLIDA